MSENKNAPVAQEPEVRMSKYNAEYRLKYPNVFMFPVEGKVRRVDPSENSDYTFIYVVAGHEYCEGPNGKLYASEDVIDRVIVPSHRMPDDIEELSELVGRTLEYRYLKPARKVGKEKQKVKGETYTVFADENRKELKQVEVTEWFDRVDWNSIRFKPLENGPTDEEIDQAMEQTEEKAVGQTMPWD